mmetsp:Transcript_40534/g.101382  ORF Transcript_40534/g.101382 Transcript_40534/m.101382 type:complete len:237 (+) Transcript_40534:54-764(+)
MRAATALTTSLSARRDASVLRWIPCECCAEGVSPTRSTNVIREVRRERHGSERGTTQSDLFSCVLVVCWSPEGGRSNASTSMDTTVWYRLSTPLLALLALPLWTNSRIFSPASFIISLRCAGSEASTSVMPSTYTPPSFSSPRSVSGRQHCSGSTMLSPSMSSTDPWTRYMLELSRSRCSLATPNRPSTAHSTTPAKRSQPIMVAVLPLLALPCVRTVQLRPSNTADSTKGWTTSP